MRKALKEIIDTAEERLVGDFDYLMFVSNGIYDGFWGKNGFDNILILGFVKSEKKWYIVSRYGDVFNIYYPIMGRFTLDINHKYGVPTIGFGKPIHIDNREQLSSVVGELREGDSECGER